MKRTYAYLFRKQPVKFIVLCFMQVVCCLCGIGFAYVMGICVSLALSGEPIHIARYGISFLVFLGADALINIGTDRLKYQVLMNARINLRSDVLWQIENLDIAGFRKRHTGSWIAAVSNDIDIIGDSYFKVILDLMIDMLEFAASLLILTWMSPLLSAFVVLLTLIQMAVPKTIVPKIAEAKSVFSKSAGTFTSTVSEHFQGFDILKGFHLMEHSFTVMQKVSKDMEEKRFHMAFLSRFAYFIGFLFSSISYIGLYFIGAILVSKGMLSLASLVAASQLVVYIISPMETMSTSVSEIMGARKVIASLSDINKQRADQNAAEWEIPEPPYEMIQMEQVSFAFEEKVIFENADLTLKRGKKYILSADSGKGKTTLVRLLSGALMPDAGRISLNQSDIHSIDPEVYTKVCMVCEQNNFIFHDTLRNNITLFADGYSDDQILEALKKVGFLQILDRDPAGLDMMIRQDGANLSGGERQRIELARLELLRAPFVILDESFANLDKATAEELIRRITSDPDRTVVVISHQLDDEMYQCFDSIIQLEGHRLTEKEIHQ